MNLINWYLSSLNNLKICLMTCSLRKNFNLETYVYNNLFVMLLLNLPK